MNPLKLGKPKLNLKSIPTKSRYLLDKDSGMTPVTSLTHSDSLKPSYQTLEAFNQKYEILDLIGTGANGKVYQCRHRKLDKIFAVKISKTDIETIPHVKASYNHTKMLQHSAIIHYKGLYISPQGRVSYLVMEYFRHRELSEFKNLEEKQVSKIAYQLLEAVAFMHQNKVCHRDIKPDNILYDQTNRKIKLTDFGESKATRDGRLVKQMMTCTGTLQYKAPELFRGGIYDQLIDEWAVGVTIYELLTGRKPFDSEYKATIIDNIENCRISFEQQFWKKHPGIWAKKLIQNLLSPRQKRITAQKALENLWFQGHAEVLTSIHMQRKPKSSNFAFESLVEKVDSGSQKKPQRKDWKHFQVTDSGIIDSEEEYISDNDDQVIQNENDSKSGCSDGENNCNKIETSSSQCKSPLVKQEIEIKIKNVENNNTLPFDQQYAI